MLAARDRIARSLVDWTAGYPGCEHQIRAALAEVVGKDKSEFFFDKVCKTLYQRQYSTH